MSDSNHEQIREQRLQELRANAGDDPIFSVQLEASLKREKQREQSDAWRSGLLFQNQVSLGRVGVFFSSPAINESHAISAGLAGQLLVQYDRMYVELATRNERRLTDGVRRKKGSSPPELMLTGTPKGSFGLELVPKPETDAQLGRSHAESIRELGEILVRLARSEGNLDAIVSNIPPKVVQAAKTFFGLLAKHHAEVRFTFDNRASERLNLKQIVMISEALQKSTEQETKDYVGVFRGLCNDSHYFDFQPENEAVITGKADDLLNENDCTRIDQFKNKRCIATILKSVVVNLSGQKNTTYILLDVKPIEGTAAKQKEFEFGESSSGDESSTS